MMGSALRILLGQTHPSLQEENTWIRTKANRKLTPTTPDQRGNNVSWGRPNAGQRVVGFLPPQFPLHSFRRPLTSASLPMLTSLLSWKLAFSTDGTYAYHSSSLLPSHKPQGSSPLVLSHVRNFSHQACVT